MMGERVKYTENPCAWEALRTAGQSNIYVGMVQLKRIGFSLKDIRELVEQLMDKV